MDKVPEVQLRLADFQMLTEIFPSRVGLIIGLH